uniref:Putative phenol 2-monooxygenase n=1 Tax=Cladonia metacorallifera TaxID=195773 RepID=G9BD53_CLAME|nr:putative phenol 2-monooxygenase [Cladonia metacorallifera]
MPIRIDPYANMHEKVDVFICGSGSAGLSAATWLSRYKIRCKIVESRPGPLEVGQADGVQSRTTEILESFGIVEDLLKQGYHNVETTFWNPGKGGGIERTRSIPSTDPGLSHLPRVMLSQARLNSIFLKAMKEFNGQEVDYGYKVLEVEVDEEKAKEPDSYPVTIVTEKDGKQKIFEAKYALGCDGAHSTVRKSLGIKMTGDSSDSIWGVMDFIPRTDFPDIRKLNMMHTKAGVVLNIPREGGIMNRFYTELPLGTVAKEVKIEDLQATARRIFHPYQLDFPKTIWWSAYAIGQRIADDYTKANRVFLTGDACHTHSPKGGQGLNVSLQDGYNIGWKLASVLKGQTGPDILSTYVMERQMVGENLIEWDKDWVKLMTSTSKEEGGFLDANNNIDFSEVWLKAGPFTAGLTITYGDSTITRAKDSTQSVAEHLKVGMRFPSAQVVRDCDAREMQLSKALPSDGRWRIVVFAGDIRQDAASRKLDQLGEYLFSEQSPVQKYSIPGSDIDSFIEVVLVLSGERLKINQEQIPHCFRPVTGKWGTRDLHKVYVDDQSYHNGHGRAYEFYGVLPEKGAMAIVRPDGYVSMVLEIEDHGSISRFFDGFARQRRSKYWNGRGHDSMHN